MMTLNLAQQKEPKEYHSPLQGIATVLVTVLRLVTMATETTIIRFQGWLPGNIQGGNTNNSKHSVYV